MTTSVQERTRRGAYKGFLERFNPILVTIVGAGVLGVSALLVKAADTPGSNATFFRCLLAVPILGVMATLSRRAAPMAKPRASAPPRVRQTGLYIAAGVFLAADMILWAESIRTLGAGVATAIVNVQLVVVPLLCRFVFGEPIHRFFWLAGPVMLGAVLLAGGAGDSGSVAHSRIGYGLFTGIAAGVFYGAYLVILRRLGAPSSRVNLLLTVTVVSGVVAFAVAIETGALDWRLQLHSFAALILLAVSGQVFGWLCVASGLSRLSSTVGPSLLLIQPVTALALGVWAAHESPTSLQVVGCMLVFLVGAAVIWSQGTDTAGATR